MGSSKRDGFYKRGKVWWTRDPVTHQRCSTRCTDLEAAKRWRVARERIAADPAHAAAQAARVGEWVGRWIAMMTPGWSDATLEVANQKLGHVIRIFGAEAPLSVITPGTGDAYMLQRRAEGVVDLTIGKEFTHLIAVLRHAKRGDAYTGDPESVRPETLRATYRPRKRALTRPELGGLLSELTPARGAVPAMIVGLGCRWAEAMRLLPSDFEAYRVLIRGTKTEGSYRWVPILSLYRPLLEAALPHLPLEPWENVRRDLGRACRRAGIEPCTPNDLRRTHATLLVEAGVDRDVIRRLLGHTTAAMVDRVYGQPTTEALGALAERKLLEAAPLEPVQFRHSEAPADENSGASSGFRTPDLRFTKPAAEIHETTGEAGNTPDHAGRGPASTGETDCVPLAAGTRTSQPISAPGLEPRQHPESDDDSGREPATSGDQRPAVAREIAGGGAGLAAGQGPPCAHRIIAFDASGRARCDTCGWRERQDSEPRSPAQGGRPEPVDGSGDGAGWSEHFTRWHLAAAASRVGAL
jgi:integrase